MVRAYLLTREVFDFEPFWQAVEALDNKVPDAVQSGMLIASERLMMRATLWFLRYRNLKDDIAKTVERFAPGVKALAASLDRFLSPDESDGLRQAAERLTQSNVPNDLAMRLVRFDPLYSALDIAEVATETKRSVGEVAGVYFVVGGRLNLSWLHKQIGGLPADSHWQALAKAALRDEFSDLQRELTSLVLKLGPPARVPDALINAVGSGKRERIRPQPPAVRRPSIRRRLGSFDAVRRAAGAEKSGLNPILNPLWLISNQLQT